jgi:two-component system NtrC family sensor kinase
MFVFRLESGYLGRPFRLAVPMLWITLGLAVLIALPMAFWGTRRITAPVSALTRRMIAFATGQKEGFLVPSGPREIRHACEAFNTLSNSLQAAEEARDAAQRSLVQNAKLASVGQLAAGIGHELSNPLNNIYSLTKLGQRHLNQEDPTWGDLGQIREEAERASGIIKGLLNFARQGPTSPSDFDLGDWVRESLALVERLAEKHQVKLQLHPGETCSLHADRSLLQQALVNVLINAVQATPQGGEVSLSWKIHDRRVEVQIRDQGRGLDPGTIDQVFDPFFTSKPEGEGTGLGLSIALGICQRHDGDLSLVNHPEGGAMAILGLPLR